MSTILTYWKQYVYFAVALPIRLLAAAGAYHRNRQEARLPDLGHALIPEYVPFMTVVNDLLIILILIYGAFYTASRMYKTPGALELLAHFCVVTTTLALIRNMLFLSTSLPSPALHCLPNSTTYAPPEEIHELFRGLSGQCGDLIFSGHMLHALSVYKITRSHVIFIMCFVQSYTILASRSHYTVDVLLAWIIVPNAWDLYYSWIYHHGSTRTCQTDDICDENVPIMRSISIQRPHARGNKGC